MTYDDWRLACPPYCEEADEPDPIQEREDWLAEEADRLRDES